MEARHFGSADEVSSAEQGDELDVLLGLVRLVEAVFASLVVLFSTHFGSVVRGARDFGSADGVSSAERGDKLDVLLGLVRLVEAVFASSVVLSSKNARSWRNFSVCEPVFSLFIFVTV